MGKATGVFLILAGVGTAALVLPTVDKDADRQLAEAVHSATGTLSSGTVPMPVPARRIAPGIAPGAVLTHAAPPTETARKAISGRVTLSGAFPSAAEMPPVLIAPPQVAVRNTGVSVAHVDSQAREVLAHDIQRELKRVGCYEGDISGEWDGMTRRGMKDFLDRINADLPIDQPDLILRTMVQGHPGHACGAGCPVGQTPNHQGRCLPSQTIAQNLTPKTTVRPSPRRDADAVLAPMPAPETPRAYPTVPKPAWETSVVAAAPAIPAARNLQPFDGNGKMAMGAPLPVPAPPGSAAPLKSRGSGIVNIPGAIAALGMGSSPPSAPAVGFGHKLATLSPAQTPLAPLVTGSTGVSVAGHNSAGNNQHNQSPHARPKRDPVYHAPTQRFHFPPPSFVGVRSQPRYVTSYPRPRSSSFSQILNQLRDGGGR